jgi:hypothetical protein
MIAAASEEAVRAGDFTWVLGELHVGVNSLRSAFFAAHHPTPGSLIEAMARDLPDPVVYLLASREAGGATPRTGNGLVCEKDLRLVFAHDSCGVPPERALPVGDLVLEEVDGELVVRTRDGRRRFEVMEVLGDHVMYRMVQAFAVVPQADHVPRVSIDRLVVRRESWRLAGDELAFATMDDEARRFLALRRTARARGVPRFGFVRVPTEKKPFFLDLDSPLSVDVLARAVRRAQAADGGAWVVVTEMRPGPDQMWLVDGERHRYSSELRVVAVDGLPWSFGPPVQD